jgi:hypothetical protein
VVDARHVGVGLEAGEPVEGRGELLRLLEQLGPLGAPRVVDRLEQPQEPLLGEVGAAVERLAVRREEHRHRPAAAAGHGLHGVHVDGVDVRALLPIDLDVDEQAVHHPGDVGVLEALVGHDVAPVASRIPDGEEDRAVLLGGRGERLVAPGVPVDGVVAVLPEVGRRLVGEPVHLLDATGRRGAPRLGAGRPLPSRRWT